MTQVKGDYFSRLSCAIKEGRVISTIKGRTIWTIQRDRFLKSIKPTDIFIVSYPRSGTTWLGFILENLLKKPDEEAKPPYKYAMDVNSEYEMWRKFQKWPPKIPDPRLLRIHAPYDPVFPRVIYLLRDPRDVMVSLWHYTHLREPGFNLSMKEFLSTVTPWPCGWDEHVGGYLLDRQHPDLLLVRYEDMRQHTLDTIRSIVNFASLTFTDNDIKKAIEASRINKMRKLEEEFKEGWAAKNSNEKVFRRGKIGGWKDELSPDCLQILQEKYGNVMRKVGYELV